MTLLTQTLFDKSQALIPGGVNSPVRAFRRFVGWAKWFALPTNATVGK